MPALPLRRSRNDKLNNHQLKLVGLSYRLKSGYASPKRRVLTTFAHAPTNPLLPLKGRELRMSWFKHQCIYMNQSSQLKPVA